MNIKIQIQEIDYDALAESLYPSFKENISSSNRSSRKLLSGLLNILGETPLKTLSIIPQSKKTELAVFLINHIKEHLMKQLQERLRDTGISLTSESPEIINCDDDIILTINNLQITRQNIKNSLS